MKGEMILLNMIQYNDNTSILGMPILHHGLAPWENLSPQSPEADPTPRSHLQTHSTCSVQGTRQRPRSYDAVLISPDWLLVIVSCMRADNAIQPQLPQQVLRCRQALLADVALALRRPLWLITPFWMLLGIYGSPGPSPLFPPFLGSGSLRLFCLQSTI